ncbi:VanZ family protein [Leifsonia shinshuensis]|uniref:VanZ family protein n=1 Tax=Leifsonia shinshuensis TaxID=150026 RepID=UPI001F5103FE|nr:VanZ family protein [Leifsonia shinshuensis]MCI0156980.1 VanZ family protein [Leifsonia shinshuensis]
MPFDRRIRTGAIIALAGYAVFVAVIGFWPTPVDRPFDPALFRFLITLRGVGIAPKDAYDVIEFTANVAFFVVPAVLVVLIVGRRRWWIAPVGGLLCSITIELAQHFMLPHRFGTVNDVIANTLGALIGCGIGVLVLGRRPQPRRS